MTKTETLSDKKRAAIIDAATVCFKEHGFQATSMDQIAHTARVSKRTVYNHFQSKEILFLTIVEHLFSLICSAANVKFTTKAPLKTQLTQIAQQEIQLMSDVDFIDLLRIIVSQTMLDASIVNDYMSKVEALEAAKAEWFQKAIDAQRLKGESATFLAHQFNSLIKGFCFWPQLMNLSTFPDAQEQAKIITSSVEMFLNYYSI